MASAKWLSFAGFILSAFLSANAQVVIMERAADPIYPPMPRMAQVGGEVTVRVLVRRDGSVVQVQTWSGHPLLLQAAIDMAKQSTYSCLGCRGVRALLITYRFVLIDPSDLAPGKDRCGNEVPHVGTTLTREPQNRIVIKAEIPCISTQSSQVSRTA